MFVHHNPRIPQSQKIVAPSTTQHRLFPTWRPGRCDLSSGNKLKLDGAESDELGGSCSNSNPKYLQVSCLSLADTVLLLELLFCPFLEFHTCLTAILGLTCSEKRRQMSAMLVIVLQDVIVSNPNKTIFLNHLFHGEVENFLNDPHT